MKLHRFYLGKRWEREVQHFGQERCWIQDKDLTKQILKVLRFRVGDEISLYDGEIEVLYKITEIKPDEIALHKVTNLEVKKPWKHVLLAWSLLKKDNNDWVLQKATELGVTHFAPLITERSEKTGFNIERANKIVIEASEQCGRVDIPLIDEVRDLRSFIGTYKNEYSLYYCDERSSAKVDSNEEKSGVIIGPEGGWSESEINMFNNENIGSLSLGQLTLRAETAAVVSATRLLGVSL